MLATLIPVFFVIGYILIAFEHPVRLNKAAPALLTAFLVWTLLSITQGESALQELPHHSGNIAGILFFLLSAMVIVETIDSHKGLDFITRMISTNSRTKLYWLVGMLTFILSAVLDNMTTAIVMSALLRKMIKGKEDLWRFAGLVIIAANAGGAWSPIGDVTTIMLWIGGQITSTNVMAKLLIPSLVCTIVPLAWLSITKRGSITLANDDVEMNDKTMLTRNESLMVLVVGLATLFAVPIFKHLTGLPPYIGLLGGLGILWIVTEVIHKRHPLFQERDGLTITSVIKRIDTPSVLFFLGILLAVSGLETGGYLKSLAELLDTHIGNVYAVNGIIGGLSAIVDNVPLVAAAMGMYPLETYPTDHIFWELLAFCAGTGGSVLIIGSAAGVATMGILGIDFMWYVRKVSLLALSGYIAGMLTFWLLN